MAEERGSGPPMTDIEHRQPEAILEQGWKRTWTETAEGLCGSQAHKIGARLETEWPRTANEQRAEPRGIDDFLIQAKALVVDNAPVGFLIFRGHRHVSFCPAAAVSHRRKKFSHSELAKQARNSS